MVQAKRKVELAKKHRARAYNRWMISRASSDGQATWSWLSAWDRAYHVATRAALEVAPPVVVTTCGCGTPYTLDQFRGLRNVKYTRYDDGQGPPLLESRRCDRTPAGVDCGSHTSVWLDAEGNVVEYTL